MVRSVLSRRRLRLPLIALVIAGAYLTVSPAWGSGQAALASPPPSSSYCNIGVNGSYDGTNSYYTSKGYTAGIKYFLFASDYYGYVRSSQFVLQDFSHGTTIVGYITSVVSSSYKSNTVTLYGTGYQNGTVVSFTIVVNGNQGVYYQTFGAFINNFRITTSAGYDSGTVIQPYNSIQLRYYC